MLRIVRTEKTREVFNGPRRVFLSTIGYSGEWGECPEEAAEHDMFEFLRCWGFRTETQ